MEFMLMRGDCVIAYEELSDRHSVLDALKAAGGIAYYWCDPDYGWCCIPASWTILNVNSQDPAINVSNVPDVIKLAAMLV